MANQPTKYKKFVATAATATLVASAIVPVASAASFTDVAADSEYKVFIDKAVEMKLFNDGENFNPTQSVKRSQVVLVMGRLLEEAGFKADADYATNKAFSDVSSDELLKYGNIVKNAGVFTGYTDGTLKPNENINRENMAAVFNRAAKAITGVSLVEAAEKIEDKKVADLDTALASNQPAIQALRDLEISTSENFGPKGDVQRRHFAKFAVTAVEVIKTLKVEEVKELAVASVKAINATQLVVEFTAAVKEDTIVDKDGKLVADVFTTFTSLDKGAELAKSTAKLSKDGKTLTITTTEGTFEGRYDIVIENATDKAGEKIAKYEVKNLDLGEDKTAPVLETTTKVDASTFTVKFSEPLSTVGTWSFVNAKGEEVAVTAELNKEDASEVTLKVAADVKAGTEITGTVIGAKDTKGLLLAKNPSTITIVKGDKDGVAPEVASIKVLGLDKLEVKFSEEVQGLKAANITVGSVAGTELEVSETDKTVYTVKLASKVAAGLHTVTINTTDLTDLTGEKFEKASFAQLANFSADTVAPKLVSSKVVVNDKTKEEELVLTFDKEITKAPSTADATVTDKDFITTEGEFKATFKYAKKANSTEDNTKELVVALKDVTFDGEKLVEKANYTVAFAKGAFENASTSKVEKFEVKFTRGTDSTATNTDKPEVSKINEVTNANGIKVVKVTFDKAVDGATATTASNYVIDGVQVEKATLTSATTVELTLKANSNVLSGERNVTVSNVKAKNGDVMKTVTQVVALTENVAPTATKAQFTATENGKVTTITLTFSEAVSVSANAFEVFVGDAKTAVASTVDAIAEKSEAKTVVIKVANGLSTDDIAKEITVKLADDAKVLDVNSNKLEFTSIKAAQ